MTIQPVKSANDAPSTSTIPVEKLAGAGRFIEGETTASDRLDRDKRTDGVEVGIVSADPLEKGYKFDAYILTPISPSTTKLW